MRPEHGVRLISRPGAPGPDTAAAKKLLPHLDWVYLGAEFCENLLEDGFCGEAGRWQAEGKKVCLLTPLLTERGVKAFGSLVRRLLAACSAGRLDPARLELTVNDLGAAALAAKERWPFKLAAGRQISHNLLQLEKKSLKAVNRPTLAFFSGLGIERFEISPAGRMPPANFRSRAFGLGPGAFRVTLHYPYLDLTTTRTCPVGMPYVAPRDSVSGINCGRECEACSFEVDHPWIKEKLHLRGNTVFAAFPKKGQYSPAEAGRLNADRLVYSPFP
ncbi:MAG: hypothetical protein PHV33_06065 [Elusimicrobiales bacterium]|nr:hypothetical protein [Elusimicrobiales bacterium]